MVIEGLYLVHACFMEFGTVNPETPAFGVLWLSRLSPSARPVNSGPQFRTSWSYLVDDSFWGRNNAGRSADGPWYHVWRAADTGAPLWLIVRACRVKARNPNPEHS